MLTNEFIEIYRANQLPVFQNRMFNTDEEAVNCIKGDVILVQDLKTGLIFNKEFKPELMRYDENYQNEQAVSNIFRTHLFKTSETIKKHFPEYKLIEIGCGKGYFLEYLDSLGFNIKGFDPAYEGSNSNIIKNYFTKECGLNAEGIILRHVLEHVQNPIDFLKLIRNANGGGGKIYIEVPCFDWICAHRAWFDIFYEHVNYFRITDFTQIFGHVYETGHCFGGQYLYVIADLASTKTPHINTKKYFELPPNFTHMADHYVNYLKRKDRANTQTNTVIWGASSKGVIFALFMLRAHTKIDFVVDINPAKQGKFLAGSGLQVSSPNQILTKLPPNSDIFVMNSNYLPEIKQITNNHFNYHMVDHEFI
ncbi:MAG: class I SAM-dependent methyltransferase [Methylomicrobium sp.]